MGKSSPQPLPQAGPITPPLIHKDSTAFSNSDLHEKSKRHARDLLDRHQQVSRPEVISKGPWPTLPQIAKKMPDVILMDIKLPGMSGIECLTLVRKFAPDVHT